MRTNAISMAGYPNITIHTLKNYFFVCLPCVFYGKTCDFYAFGSTNTEMQLQSEYKKIACISAQSQYTGDSEYGADNRT